MYLQLHLSDRSTFIQRRQFKINIYMLRYMIYLSTAIGLTPGGSSKVHIYTKKTT